MKVATRLLLATLVVHAVAACSRGGEAAPPPDLVEVVKISAYDLSLPLRELAAAPAALVGERETEEAEPARRIPHPAMRRLSASTPDRVVQDKPAPKVIAAPEANFEGLGAGIAGFTPGGVPPDTAGDIGENHYVEVVNSSLAVFSRAGALVMGPVATSTLWTGFPGACAQTNDGDGTVRYDHLAKRWVIAQFSIGPNAAGPYYQCVAVSTTSDPTGTYTRYQFNYTALNDYPKMGLWPDGYYFTFNMFNVADPNGGFLGGKVCAMDRVKMLAGAADATMQCFDTGPNYGGLLPADLDGRTPPPANAPNYLVALNTETTLAYWKLHVDFATPANSTFSTPSLVTVSAFAPLCGGGTCVVQPGIAQQLDSLADRPMNRFAYRRFADREALVFSHAVTAGAGGGVRWYELRTPETPTVFQQGTYAPDAGFRFIPSAAMDAVGNIAAMYSVSSSTVFPSIHYTARVPSDPPGVMGQGEGIIVAGTASQPDLSRWGDYASLNVDPLDDCTFWATHEYRKETPVGAWRTRVASFKLPSCASFAVTPPESQTVAQKSSATYTLTTATTAGAAQTVNLSITGLPAGVTAEVNPTTVTSGQTATVTVRAEATAELGAHPYTITAAGGVTTVTTEVALTVTEGGADEEEGDITGGCSTTSATPGGALGGLVLVLGVALLRRRRQRS
jgi:uncharacterized protein (TIGR03382 family)